MALQVNGRDWYNYTADASGNFTGNYYWQNKNSITVQGICPATAVESMTWSVESDQSSDADYQSGDLLASGLTNVNYGSTAHLTFRHQTAKVVVNVSREGLPDAIDATASDISLGIGEDENILMDGTFTLPTVGTGYGTWTPGTTEGSITPHLSGTTASGCVATYEALVIPQTIRSGAWLLTFNATKDDASYGPFYYMLQKDTEWKAGYKYTYNVTITLYGLQDLQCYHHPLRPSGIGRYWQHDMGRGHRWRRLGRSAHLMKEKDMFERIRIYLKYETPE